MSDTVILHRYAYPQEIDAMRPLACDNPNELIDIGQLRDVFSKLRSRGSFDMDDAFPNEDPTAVYTIEFPFHIDETEQTFCVVWTIEEDGYWEFAGVLYDVLGELVADFTIDNDDFHIVSTPNTEREVCGVYEYHAEGINYLLELEEAPF